MFYEVRASFAHTDFGTDALGSIDVDHEGYGVVASEVELDLIRDAREAGVSPDFSIARRPGNMSGSKLPNIQVTATKPRVQMGKNFKGQTELYY